MDTFKDLQAAMYYWQSRVMPDTSVEDRVVRASEEWHEVAQELEGYDGSPESHKRLAQEVVDTIIVLTGVLVTMGVDLASEITAKVNVIFQKYNPHKHQELVLQGMSNSQAIGELKKRWRD